MIVKQGEKFHIVMRRNYEAQLQRHFLGVVDEVDGATVRSTGYVFIYDEMKAQYIKKTTPRTTVLDLSESGYIVNMIPPDVVVDELKYETIDRTYLAITDGSGFELEINEYGPKR